MKLKSYIASIPLILCFFNGLYAQAPEKVEPWTLRKCIDYAIANSITVKTTKLNSNAAQVNYEQSKLERLPNLTAGLSQTMTNGTSIDPITSKYEAQQIHAGNGSISSQWTLYGGNQVGNQIKQRRQLVAQNSLYEAEAQNNISLSVTEAYMMALYNHSGITIAKNNLTLSMQQMDQIQAKLNAGSLTAKDLADAQSQKASSQYNLIVAQNTFAQQVLTLKQLLELEPGVAFAIDTNTALPTTFQELPSKEDVYHAALANMPEIKAAQMQIDINNTALALSRVGYRPTLSMSGRLYTGYTNTRNMEFSQQLNSNFNQQLGLNLSIPIFDRGATWSKVGNAKINIKKAEITYTTAQKELYRKIETAWLNASSKQSEAQAAQVQNEAAQLAYSLTKQQFDLGLVSPTDLQITQNTLLSAQQHYVQAKFQYALYISLVQFYQGSLLNK